MDPSPLSRYDLGAAPAAVSGDRIIETPDLARVRALRAREPITPEQVEAMSRMFAPHNTDLHLHDHQAVALRELYQTGGLVAPLKVGAGKTLITQLAPTLLRAERPVFVTQASLIDEAKSEFVTYRSAGWDVRLPHLVSYAKIGSKKSEHELMRLAPDLLMFDEAHKLKNLKSASSVRRVARAIQALRPRVAMLSGSMFGPKLMEYWHLLCWALGPHAPVPLVHAEACAWAQALDQDTDGFRRTELGALATLPGADFHEYKLSRAGIVPTMGEQCTAAIELHRWAPPMPPVLEGMIAEVHATKTRPDGELLEDAEVADTLQQLAQGFWYRWDPMPPDWWLDPRRGWHRYVRTIVDMHLDGFDSPFMVRSALARLPRTDYVLRPEHKAAAAEVLEVDPHAILPQHWYRTVQRPCPAAEPPDADLGRALMHAWDEVKERYEPTTVAEWIDDAPLRAAAEYAQAAGTDPCLVWTRHTAAGVRLRELGIPYFAGGTNPRIVAGQASIACSIAAHGTGKNLQAWHRNLILTCPANTRTLEQLMGRTHRKGQSAATVSYAFMTCTDYQRDVLSRVQSEAPAAGESAGSVLKIAKGTWS
jgi:hypothetical protein